MCVLCVVGACSTPDPKPGGYPNQPVTLPPTATATATAAVESRPVLASAANAALFGAAASTAPVVGQASDHPMRGETEARESHPDTGTAPSVPQDIERSYLDWSGEGSTHRKAPATKYANLQPGACRMEIRRRRIAAVSATGMAIGIASPMRLNGPLGDVRWVTPGPKVVHGMLDCRLVLLLDDLSQVLSVAGVGAVYVDGFYRPKAHLPGKKAPSQHAFGLAIDIHGFGMKDGRTLLVERDFGGKIGEPVCGKLAWIEPQMRETIELRNIVCAMARAKLFHYLLTPNHDPSHANHLHGDIKRGAREHVVR